MGIDMPTEIHQHADQVDKESQEALALIEAALKLHSQYGHGLRAACVLEALLLHIGPTAHQAGISPKEFRNLMQAVADGYEDACTARQEI